MAAIVFPFIDRASRMIVNGDTTRVVGIELDIQATQGGVPATSNFTEVLSWKRYHATSTNSVVSVFLVNVAGRASDDHSLWKRCTLGTNRPPSTISIHQDTESV